MSGLAAAASETPLSPPPTYDSLGDSPELGPSRPSSPANQAAQQPARPRESFQTSQSQLVRLSWSSSVDDLPSEDEAMTLEPLPCTLPALALRPEDSHVRLVDNSAASARAGRPQSLRPFVQAVAIKTWSNVKVITFFDIEIVLFGQTEPIVLHRRYSDFLDLKERLDRVYPTLRLAMGRFPSKSGPRRFDERFLDKRRRRLQEWLTVVLLHPDLGVSPLVRDWLLPPRGSHLHIPS